MNIFVISLPDNERRASVANQLDQTRFKIVNAVQTSLEAAIKTEAFNYTKFRSINKNFLADNAVGCVLSHFKVYRLMQERKLSAAIILEDDFKLLASFEELSVVYDHLHQSDAEVCLLGYSKMNAFDIFNYNLSNPLLNRQKINSKYSIYDRKLKTSCGAVAYYISAKAVDKILRLSPPYFVADEWSVLSDQGLTINYLSPHIVAEDQRIKSSIEAQRSLRNRRRARGVLGMVEDVLKIVPRYIKGKLIR
jgi:glycosyl transferase, family 25